MTFHSKMRKLVSLLVVLPLAVALIGCGSDPGAPIPTQKASAEEVQQTQPGMNGSKAAHGGGMADMDVVPAKPGEKTGVPGEGAKAGGGN